MGKAQALYEGILNPDHNGWFEYRADTFVYNINGTGYARIYIYPDKIIGRAMNSDMQHQRYASVEEAKTMLEAIVHLEGFDT